MTFTPSMPTKPTPSLRYLPPRTRASWGLNRKPSPKPASTPRGPCGMQQSARKTRASSNAVPTSASRAPPSRATCSSSAACTRSRTSPPAPRRVWSSSGTDSARSLTPWTRTHPRPSRGLSARFLLSPRVMTTTLTSSISAKPSSRATTSPRPLVSLSSPGSQRGPRHRLEAHQAPLRPRRGAARLGQHPSCLCRQTRVESCSL
mmetsp:Transcript_19483/g.46807  ORF Transcript_19483/g.46807 Transcript_19483/m.46807 type:complete len:204 (+) Transcript_19483:1292-1903(+)